jgi:hypothetical protein
MTAFFADDLAGMIATWAAALVTVGVWAYLVGERRIFRLAQHLLIGLSTGYLALLAIREVLLPRLVQPLATDSAGNPLLWVALARCAVMAAAHWLPRSVVSLPVSVLVAGTAAFALGGAVVGTLLPQLGATMLAPGLDAGGLANGVLGAGVTGLVLLAFLHGAPRARILAGAAGTGRWLLLGGIGGWLGFLLVSRLSLLVDRVGFLLRDWLGIIR